MPQYLRSVIPGGTFFFTVITYNRRRLLTEEVARSTLRSAFRTVRQSRPFRIDAIVLLPDHLHCVWTLPRGDNDYSTRWSRIKAAFTESYLQSGGADSSVSVSRAKRGERGVWQRRFYEHAVRDESDLKRCVDYVHINPVKHKLVQRVCDWPWSSFHRYVSLGEYDAEWGSSPRFFGDEWLVWE